MYCEHSNNFDYYSPIPSLRNKHTNTVVDQLYGYFKQLVTDFIRGNDTTDKS
jgi:hypothetical protein